MEKQLRSILKKRGITQRELAAEIGISPAQLSLILKGTRRLSVNKVIQLSKITGIPIERFYR
jgi:transcriptional regulator with XRE-family HTH domain